MVLLVMEITGLRNGRYFFGISLRSVGSQTDLPNELNTVPNLFPRIVNWSLFDTVYNYYINLNIVFLN